MRRPGAMLLEMLVGLAIFVMAAAVLLAAFGDMSAAVERQGVLARAADLARTRMSELEAGLISIEDLRMESNRPSPAAAGRGADPGSDLAVDATIRRSEFEGLTLVELRVFHAGQETPRFVLRQLVALPGDRRDAFTEDAP